jgi:hypothetical protein
VTPLCDERDQRCTAPHAVEVIKPLQVGPHGPIRHADPVRDLLVGLAIGDQIDDRNLFPRERIDSACLPTLA